MSQEKSSLAYRREIDGLRAVAIGTVVLFHAQFGFPGGFVGVDVFFVISGFLITSLLYRSLLRGDFDIVRFWERRARRIGPAWIAATIAILATGWFILLPEEFVGLGRAMRYQSLFAANIFCWRDSGYFDGSSEFKPLLHMWSLAVEEQYYLAIPLILWVGIRTGVARNWKALVAGLSLLGLASLATSVWWVHGSPSAAFFLLPSRAWELLVGSIVAIRQVQIPVLGSRFVREALALLGLAAILAASFAFDGKTPFPGIAALLPVLGAAAFILANGRPEGDPVDTLAGRILSARPFVALGLISYSLYLWHWPILAFARVEALDPLGRSFRLLLVAISVVAAWTSWKFVENPFRRGLVPGRKIFIPTGIGLAILFAGGWWAVKSGGAPGRWSEKVNRYAAANQDVSFHDEVTVEQAKRGEFYRIGRGDGRAVPEVLVWGDSHAMSMMAAFDSLFRRRGIAGIGATHSATAPVLGWYRDEPMTMGPQAVEYNRAVVDHAVASGIRTAVLVACWSGYVDHVSPTGGRFGDALVETVELLERKGIDVWVVLDVPGAKIDIPRMLARSRIRSVPFDQYLEAPPTVPPSDGLTDGELARLRGAGARILNPKEAFLDGSGRFYAVEKDGFPLYHDSQHMTTTGALTTVLPYLDAHFEVGKRPDTVLDKPSP